jgi:hypothetical protein
MIPRELRCRMKSKFRAAITPGILLILITLIAGSLGLMVFRPNEPVYEQKPLNYWLTMATVDDSGFYIAKAREALHIEGTNAIPTLLRMLCVQESSGPISAVWRTLRSWIGQARLPANLYRSGAEFGFSVLGATASNAVTPMANIFYDRNSSDSARRSVVVSLARIGPHASSELGLLLSSATNAALPFRSQAIWASCLVGKGDPDQLANVLTNCARDRNLWVREAVVSGIEDAKIDAEWATSVLIDLLNDPEERMRGDAARALGELSRRTEPLLQVLTNLLRDENARVRLFAAEALCKLEPGNERGMTVMKGFIESDDSDMRLYAESILSHLEANLGGSSITNTTRANPSPSQSADTGTKVF